MQCQAYPWPATERAALHMQVRWRSQRFRVLSHFRWGGRLERGWRCRSGYGGYSRPIQWAILKKIPFVEIRIGNGDGTFAAPLPVADNSNIFAMGDFNRDGIPDLAVAFEAPSRIEILLGNGDGTFTAQSPLAISGGTNVMAVGDFNGDGA